MNLSEAKGLGLKNKSRKRIARGTGSGHGKTAGRGHKGAHSRSGWSRRLGWEGGQMPLFRRLPKRGFNNARFATTYLPVNLKALEEKFEAGARVDEEAIRNAGLANGKSDGVKILGVGKLTKKLTVVASAFSASAKAAIEAAGGSCEAIGGATEEPPAKKRSKTKTSEEPKADSPAKEEPKVQTPAEDDAPSTEEAPPEQPEEAVPEE